MAGSYLTSPKCYQLPPGLEPPRTPHSAFRIHRPRPAPEVAWPQHGRTIVALRKIAVGYPKVLRWCSVRVKLLFPGRPTPPRRETTPLVSSNQSAGRLTLFAPIPAIARAFPLSPPNLELTLP